MSIVIVLVGISILIIVHELGHFLAAKYFGLLVEEFGFGFPPRFWGKKIGETIYSLNWLPFGGFVRIFGETGEGLLNSKRSFAYQPAWKRAVVIISGVAMNFLAAWVLLTSVFLIGTPEGIVITGVLPKSPAEIAGIKAGDMILGYHTVQDFVNFVNQNRGREISLEIQRLDSKVDYKVVPRVDMQSGALGVALTEAGFPRLSFLQAVWEGLKSVLILVEVIFLSFINLIIGIFTNLGILSNVVGPIGIFGVATQVGNLGLVYLIQLLAMISLNLAVLNVFPFPALDGGRLFFIIIEKIKGSPINSKTEAIANGIGFVLLLIMMVAVTVKDLVTIF